MSFTHLDIAKVDVRWQVSTIGFAANIFQVQCIQSTPHAIEDLDVLLDMGAYITTVLGPMEPHVVVDVDVLDANVYKKIGNLWNLVGPAPVTFVPEGIDDPLPSGVAALITAYTLVSRVQGKKYLPGLSEASQTAGLWVVGVLAAMLQSALLWVTPFVSSSDPQTMWYPGVYSTKQLGFCGFSGSVGTRDVPAYQRRRKAGVGT